MNRTAVLSDQAPDALGPYSQAIVAGGLVFCSGMAGIHPVTGTIADGIEAQTEQALVNLAAVLKAAGSSMEDVVKTTIFYANVDDFGRLNEVYARHMPDPPPARSAPGQRAAASRPARLNRGDSGATGLLDLSPTSGGDARRPAESPARLRACGAGRLTVSVPNAD